MCPVCHHDPHTDQCASLIAVFEREERGIGRPRDPGPRTSSGRKSRATGKPKGRPPALNPLSRVVTCKVTEEEAAKIDCAADLAGKSLSEWIRLTILSAS